MKGAGSRKSKRGTKTPRAALPPDLRQLSEEQVDEILESTAYTKLQLLELGINRFGIPRSRLMTLDKDGVRESIKSALNHEKSLGAITQEAKRGGQLRTS